MAQTVELSDVIFSAIQEGTVDLWTALPARVENYDPKRQTVNVQPTLIWGRIGEDGERFTQTLPVQNNVPVIFLGGGGFRTTYPIKPGDTCLVVICTKAIGQWLAQGGVVDSHTDGHHHHLNDGVALVGLRDFKHSLTSAPTDRMSVGSDTGASIEIHSSEVRIGSDTGTQPTIMAGNYRSAEDSLFEAMATLLDALAATIAALATASPTFTNAPAVAAFTAAVGTTATALTTFDAAVTTFHSGATTYLTTKAKVV